MADEQAICTVINEQFGAEVVYKEEELRRIDDRIQLAKSMLHRLRLGILAQQYGLSGFYLMEDYSKENVGVQASWNSFESEFLKAQQQPSSADGEDKVKEEGEVMEQGEKEVPVGELKLEEMSDVHEVRAGSMTSSTQSSCVPSEAGDDEAASPAESRHGSLVGGKKASTLLNDVRKYSQSLSASSAANSAGQNHTQGVQSVENSAEPLSLQLPASLSRFTTKKRIIVGNTSQFQDPSARSTIDGSTHKWMVYVRGPSEESDITAFVKAVRFFLHPSYHPNDIIRISKPPFHLTRYGWGEFPVRIQLEFADKCNKHVDIIHNLVLDRTHTGHQTLGSETVVDLDLVITDTKHDTSGSAKSQNNNLFSATDSATRENRVECSQLIHHIFLPASSTVDQVYLDHSYAHIVVVSQRPKLLQASNASDVMDTCDLGSSDRLSDNMDETPLDEFLHSIVKTVPLCGPESSGFHLVSPSIEHFKKWNIGRRRATEWVRALAIKRLIHTLDPPVHVAASLTTKQVMEWCRRNGYTPLDPVLSSSRGFCKYCGCQLPAGSGRGDETSMKSENISHVRCSEMMEVQLHQEQEGRALDEASSDDDVDSEQEEGEAKEAQKFPSTINQQFSTLSDPFPLFESLTAKAKKLRVLQEQQEREQVVDVLTVPAQQQRVVETVPRFRIPQTPELKWVQQTAAAIGIHIYPAVIDRMYAHVVEHMIYMACTKFTRIIMDRAVTESAQQVEADSNEERCIVPLHIYRAVKSLESCDFLTNAYMGIPSSEAGTAPMVTDRDKTLREE